MAEALGQRQRLGNDQEEHAKFDQVGRVDMLDVGEAVVQAGEQGCRAAEQEHRRTT